MSGGRADDTATGGHDHGAAVTIPNRELVSQMLEWLAGGPRPYAEVMRAWRTSCPRLSIWEDALDLRLVSLEHARGEAGPLVRLTPQGSAFLAAGDDGRGRSSVRHGLVA